MSKAFTKDDDGVPPPLPSAAARLPPGTPNYITADGHARLLARLPLLDAASARTLAGHLESARIVPDRPSDGTVRFGDRVTVRTAIGVGRCGSTGYRHYRIVGVDEVELDHPTHEHLSWLTPLARALMGAEVGDVISVDDGDGDDELELVAIG
jgi:transcription elongation factor GreB